MSENEILSVSDISHSFGDVAVLEEISLSVKSGTVTAVIGPNGSGKTTLLRIVARVLSPSEGTVAYHGPKSEREIGYMPQQPSFRSGFTTEETLAFYTSLAGGDPQSLLDRVGLAQATNRNVEALSGGMRRLLGIAQATVGDPPVVVLDEPGSGLDPGMRQQTFEVVERLATDGTAVVLSTHDMPLATTFADRIALIERGSVIEVAAPATLLEQYGCTSMQAVFEAAFETGSTAVEVAGETP